MITHNSTSPAQAGAASDTANKSTTTATSPSAVTTRQSSSVLSGSGGRPTRICWAAPASTPPSCDLLADPGTTSSQPLVVNTAVTSAIKAASCPAAVTIDGIRSQRSSTPEATTTAILRTR